MTDKELIKSLRDYVNSYIAGNPYSFNPGSALIIVNRMEELIKNKGNIQTKFNVGDKIWIAYRYEDDWYILNKEGDYVDNIKIYVNDNNQMEFYTIKSDHETQEFSSRFCFGSYEECQRWCDNQNERR